MKPLKSQRIRRRSKGQEPPQWLGRGGQETGKENMRRNPGRWRVSPSKSQRHARAYKQLLACQWPTGARDVEPAADVEPTPEEVKEAVGGSAASGQEQVQDPVASEFGTSVEADPSWLSKALCTAATLVCSFVLALAGSLRAMTPNGAWRMPRGASQGTNYATS